MRDDDPLPARGRKKRIADGAGSAEPDGLGGWNGHTLPRRRRSSHTIIGLICKNNGTS